MSVRNNILETKKIQSLTTVAANGKNVINLPLGRTYYDFFIFLTGPTWAQVEADISEVRIMANGKYIRRLNPEQISHLRKWHGYKNNKGDVNTVIHIPCVPQHLINPDGRDQFALGTNVFNRTTGQREPLTNFTVEVDMGGTVSNVTAGEVWARFKNVASDLLPYYRVDGLGITDDASATGESIIDRITTGAGQENVGLIGLHLELKATNTAISYITVEDDDGEIYNAVPKAAFDLLALEQGFTQGDDYFGIPLALNHNVSMEYLRKTMANLIVKPTWATQAPGSGFKIMTEELVFGDRII